MKAMWTLVDLNQAILPLGYIVRPRLSVEDLEDLWKWAEEKVW